MPSLHQVLSVCCLLCLCLCGPACTPPPEPDPGPLDPLLPQTSPGDGSLNPSPPSDGVAPADPNTGAPDPADIAPPPAPAGPASWSFAGELPLPGKARDGIFGAALALQDATTLIGAPGKDDYTGAAYVFVRTSGGWLLQQELKASDAQSAVAFGAAVALSGDIALVGAPGHSPPDTGLIQTGAAYVYRRSGTTWAEAQQLTLSSPQSYDYLGQSLAIEGGTAIIGAFGRNSLQGTAFVFDEVSGRWQYEARLRPEVAGAGWFGWAVDLSGNTAVMGAHVQNGSTGAAYVFTGAGSQWDRQAKLLAPDAAEADNFGQTVSASGDTIAVSAPGKGDQTGQVYVFVRSGPDWAIQQTIPSPEPAGGVFGFSFSLEGDTLAVGSPGSSAAHVYVRSGGAWSLQARLAAPIPESVEQFGFSIAISGNTLIVGAERKGEPGAGQVFVFQRQ